MSRPIKRIYITSVISVNEITFDKNDLPSMSKLKDIIIDGKISYEKANKIVRDIYSDKKVAIMGVKEIEEELVLTYADFKKYAKLEAEKARKREN